MTSLSCNNSQAGDILFTPFRPTTSYLASFNDSPTRATTLLNACTEVGNLNPQHVPVLPEYIRVVTTIFCIIILFIGVTGNSCIPVVMWKNRDLRNSTNIFLLNLSLADLLVLVVCLPTVFVELYSRPEVWILGEGLCKTIPFLELLVANASVLTIVAISLERYYAIAEPLRARAYRLTRKRTLLILISVWIVAATLTGPIIWVAKYNPETDFLDGTRAPTCITGIETFWEKFYFMSTLLVFYIIPLITLFFVYLMIGRHLLQSPGGEVEQNMQLKSRQQVVAMLVVVVSVFFICLLPYKCLIVMAMVGSDDQFSRLGAEKFYNLLYFCRIMTYVNSSVNPIIYNIMSSKFRKAFLKLLGFRRHRFHGSPRGQSIRSLSQSSIVRLKTSSCRVKLLLFNKSDKNSHSEISSTYDKSITSKSTYISDYGGHSDNESKCSSLKYGLKVPNGYLVKRSSEEDSLNLSISPGGELSYSDFSPGVVVKMFPKSNYFHQPKKDVKSLSESFAVSSSGYVPNEGASPYDSCVHLECRALPLTPVKSLQQEEDSTTNPNDVWHFDIVNKASEVLEKENKNIWISLDDIPSDLSKHYRYQFESLV